IYSAIVQASDGTRTVEVPVYAVVGDASLPNDITFTQTRWGMQAMRGLPRAPWPQTAPENEYLAYVHMSVPHNLRKNARQMDALVALHGHNGNVEATVANKMYVQHAFYSNRNAVLIVPQGKYMVASDDFGQLRAQDGLKRLIEEVLIVLYRNDLITHPVLGRVAISSH